MYQVTFTHVDQEPVEVTLETWEKDCLPNVNNIKFALLQQKHIGKLSGDLTIACLEASEQLMFSVVDEQGNCVYQSTESELTVAAEGKEAVRGLDTASSQAMPSLEAISQLDLKDLLKLQVKLCDYSLHLQTYLSTKLKTSNKLHSK
jgi:hypothetical protein